VNAIQAVYFDGESTDGRPVELELDALQMLHVRGTGGGSGIDLAWPLAEVRASERIGASRRRLYFPGGAQCETSDNDAVDALFEGRVPAASRLLHRWESGLRYAIAAMVITVAAAWAAVVWGVPALAKQAAFALPAATETYIGRDALATLDKLVLKPSKLPEARQRELGELYARMTGSIQGAAAYRLELRQGGRAGANAFALPAGIIVMTDELVELAKDNRELEAVLAHEIGHLRQHHMLRLVMQNSAAAVLIAFMAGDLTSLTSLAAAAPAMLLQASFTRDFEREADDFSLDYLAKRGIAPEYFAAILQRLEEKKRPGGKDGVSDYLSTHPSTRERIERASGHRAP
jgi:Zn-dependent protease with chaperone function